MTDPHGKIFILAIQESGFTTSRHYCFLSPLLSTALEISKINKKDKKLRH